MKYTINILKVALLFLLVTFWSCMDLEEMSLNRLAPSSFYKTPDQCMSGLVSATQLIVEDHPSYSDGTQRRDLNWAVTFQNDVWNKHFKSISNLNPIIQSILEENLNSFPQNTVNDILGQAYFLRAFNHFQLVRLYGKIPYVDENFPDMLASPPTPESREEVSVIYDKVEADLLKAIGLMSSTIDQATPGRPYSWAAKALLARVYVNRATAPLKQTEYYAKACDISNDVIENGPYSFIENIKDIFALENVKENPEFIWQYNSADDAPRANGFGPGPDEWGVWGAHEARGPWADKYPDQPRKWYYVLTRFPANLYEDPSTWRWIDYSVSTDRRPFQAKYCWPNVPREYHRDNTMYHPSTPVFRFSDMLLVYAEAANMANGGPTQLAVDRLNMIIDRANKPFDSWYPETSIQGTVSRATMTMSAQEFDDIVFRERDLELCFERETYFDVLRKEKLKEVNEPDYSINFELYRYLLPIPAADVLLIGQNPGYPLPN